jgi:hypothetical protein
LKLLKAAGSHGRTISILNSRSGAERLVKIGYVTDHAVTFDTVLYQITKRGDRALTNATELSPADAPRCRGVGDHCGDHRYRDPSGCDEGTRGTVSALSGSCDGLF